MPLPAYFPPLRRRASGFSLIEVILSLGIMGIAIVSILGLIAPTLSEVSYTQDLNSGTACIAKMNSLIESAPFWNSQSTASGETVWVWVAESHSNSPTVFLFYDEIPNGANGVPDNTPVQRVVRFNADATGSINTPLAQMAVNVPDPNSNRFPLFDTMDHFLTAVNESRISGPVIAMTLSLSALAQHFPATAATAGPYAGLDERGFYIAPAQGVLNGLFSDTNFGSFLADPDGFSTQTPFPEAYLPIYIQCFSVSISNLQTVGGVSVAEAQLNTSLTLTNRLFTYTTAKLR